MNFPSQCPYCGKDNVQNKVIHINELDNVYLDHSSYGIPFKVELFKNISDNLFLSLAHFSRRKIANKSKSEFAIVAYSDNIFMIFKFHFPLPPRGAFLLYHIAPWFTRI